MIPVIMSIRLAPHGQGNPLLIVPGPRLLLDDPAVFNHLNLPLDLIINRLLQSLQAVQILGLGPGPEFRRTDLPDGHIGIRTNRPLFHLAVGHVDIGQDAPQSLHICLRFLRRPQIRFGNDLKERNPHTVVVHIRGIGAGNSPATVDKLPRILLHMGPGDADPLHHPVNLDVQPAVLADRQIKLRRLEILRQIRIIVVLPVELAVVGDLGINGQSSLHTELNHLLIDYRKHSRQSQADRTDMGIRRSAEFRLAAAEDLGSRLQLNMDFQSDNRFILVHLSYLRSFQVKVCALLKLIRHIEEQILAERLAQDLHPNRQAVGESAGKGDARDPYQVDRHRTDIPKVHVDGILCVLSQLEGKGRSDRGDQHVILAESLVEIPLQKGPGLQGLEVIGIIIPCGQGIGSDHDPLLDLFAEIFSPGGGHHLSDIPAFHVPDAVSYSVESGQIGAGFRRSDDIVG